MTSATILLVEDDEPMLMGICELLQMEDLGYELTILTAENGVNALDQIADQSPDLIISDINMPHMTGIELLAHLRQHPQWLYIPIIFLTAKGNENDIHLAKASGVDRYITKPFDSGELIELVKSQLDRTFQLIESRRQTIASLKGDILQILNHELNTPLTYVVAYAELLLDTHENLEDLSYSSDFLRGIQAGCMRLNRLVTDFIQVIELRTGETATTYQQNVELIEDIEPILKEALARSEKKLFPNMVQVHFSSSAEPLQFLGHRDFLMSALERLFDNAIKFTFSQKGALGQVNISVSQQGNAYRIDIRDEGIGFPTYVYQQLFELFYQYNRKEYEQQGTGTGLTIAQELIHLHNGRIEVASIEGEGSTFTVILPLHDPRKEPTPSSNEPARKQATVLIVEDDSHLLEGLEELLDIFDGKYRLNTLTAKNGVEGLSQLTQRKPHLIISDIMMPKMGGFEFIERVRQMEEFIQIPFIFLTAKGERRDVVNGIVLGAEEYITKPYDSDRLLDLIVAQLDKYFQRQGLITQNFESLKRSIIQLMSPDFHNPIAIVAEHTQEVLGQIENANTDSELKVSLHKIRQGSTQLNQLVKYFIALAELTTDEARIAFDYQANSIANVSQLVREAVSIVTYQTSESELILTSTIQPNLPSIFGVAETVSDCIQKMIRFVATHYLATDRQVHLTAQQANDAIHVTISTDAQLAPKNLQSIEELLAHKRQVKVDLLGHDAVLWIVQGHLALHNGRIQINNTPHLTITLNFPIATD